jgi:hypothetical protein
MCTKYDMNVMPVEANQSLCFVGNNNMADARTWENDQHGSILEI